MPKPLQGNESGNWNPSGLFGTLIMPLRLDFIIQRQWWVPPQWSGFCIFILLSFSSCIVIYPESSDWDKVEGLLIFLHRIFEVCCVFVSCLNYALWNLFGCSNIINIEACYEPSCTQLQIPRGTDLGNVFSDISVFIRKHSKGRENKREKSDVATGWFAKKVQLLKN